MNFAHTDSPSTPLSTVAAFLRPKSPPKKPVPPPVFSCDKVSNRTETPKLEASVTPTYSVEEGSQGRKAGYKEERKKRRKSRKERSKGERKDIRKEGRKEERK